MIKKYYKKIFIFFLLIIFILFWIILFHFFSPKEIVEKIGVRNSYILAFIVSFFGGFSSWSSVSFISILVTLVLGGLNPISLGIVAGISLAMGDLILFYIGSKGRELVVGEWEKRLNKIAKFIEKKGIKKIIPFVAYIYIGWLPLPNDFMILFLAFIKYPRKKIYLPIILGDLTFTLLICVLVSKGIIF